MDTTINTLITIKEFANRLYDSEAGFEIWTKLFTKDELIALWEECKIELDTPYDDEVYEALRSLGYFEEIL